MKVAKCRFQRYRIGLVKPIVVGSVTSDHREGIIITVQDASSGAGYGEIAPLPGLHTEAMVDVIRELGPLRKTIMGVDWARDASELWEQFDERLGEVPPSVRCGVEMALTDLAGLWETDGEVVVCGLVMGTGDLYDEISGLGESGYEVVKVKVARRGMDEEIETIQRVRDRVGKRVDLRLDANRGWGLSQAVEFCSRVGMEGIEYIEEPVADPKEQQAFADRLGVGIGLDETLAGIEPGASVISKGVGAVVLKPSVLGGLSRAARWIEVARQSGVRAVLSSCFESGVAVRGYGKMALGMDIGGTAQGLDTLKFLCEDVVVDRSMIRDGRMQVGDIMLREEVLEEVRV